jgi:hypothetical protein
MNKKYIKLLYIHIMNFKTLGKKAVNIGRSLGSKTYNLTSIGSKINPRYVWCFFLMYFVQLRIAPQNPKTPNKRSNLLN